MHLLCFLLIAGFVLFSSPVSAGLYYYRDKSGMLHFTDSLSEIPQDRLPEVRRYGKEDKPLIPEGPQNSLEEEKATGKGKEAGKEAEEGDRSKEGNEIPIVERLNKEKASLEAEHAALLEEKEKLRKKKPTLNTPEQVRAYQKAMSEFNERIKAYNERNKAFQKEVDAYNSAVSGKK